MTVIDAPGLAVDDAYRYGSLLRAAAAGRSSRDGWSRRDLTTVQFAMLATLRGREDTILETLGRTKL